MLIQIITDDRHGWRCYHVFQYSWDYDGWNISHTLGLVLDAEEVGQLLGGN